MKRASYREAVAWIALNDESGSDDGPEQIKGYASTVMIADIFDVETEKVAQDIHRKREQYRKEGWPT